MFSTITRLSSVCGQLTRVEPALYHRPPLLYTFSCVLAAGCPRLFSLVIRPLRAALANPLTQGLALSPNKPKRRHSIRLVLCQSVSPCDISRAFLVFFS